MDSEADRRHSSPGFPHSDILGSRPACGSPRLIAASYVLHRLLMPGHSPYTLSSLTITLLLIHMVFQQDLFSCQRTTPMTLSSANCLEDVEQELNRNQTLNQKSNQLSVCPTLVVSRLRWQTARASEVWWSWTESNRRPPACKAGALPTELQPQTQGKSLRPDCVRGVPGRSGLRWWAWIELNYRPRAYQARALTN